MILRMRRQPGSVAVAFLALLLMTVGGVVESLRCRCTSGDGCVDGECSVDGVSATAACVTYVYDNHTQTSLLCSDSSSECPRLGDPVGRDGSYNLCCSTDLCNTGEIPDLIAPTADRITALLTTPAQFDSQAPIDLVPPPADSFVELPERSTGKLRCDCSAALQGTCKDDKGTRGKGHCVVYDGWCVTVARETPLMDLLFPGFDFPPSYHRYCTKNASLCAQGIQGDRSTLCCSNGKFCNENVYPDMDGLVKREGPGGPVFPPWMPPDPIQTRPTSPGGSNSFTKPSDTPATASPIGGGGSRKIWCHCNDLLQCNRSFPFCDTAGRCESKQHPVFQQNLVLRCVHPEQIYECLSDTQCCATDCCNKHEETCPPLQATEEPRQDTRHTCHCHNCLSHRCETEHGCFFQYDTVTRKALQDCFKDYGSLQANCSPAFARSRNMKNLTRQIGDVHQYCCRGNECNDLHPTFPDVVGEKILACNCTEGHCKHSSTMCVTSSPGGQCYSGVEGRQCIKPNEHHRRQQLCGDDRRKCCNYSSFCNADVTGLGAIPPSSPDVDSRPVTRLPTTMPPPTSSRIVVVDTIRMTTSHESLYISVGVSAALLVVVAILIALMIVRYRSRQASQLQQRQQGKQNLQHGAKRPIAFPKSTFDTNPISHRLSAWERQQAWERQRAWERQQALSSAGSLESSEQRPLQSASTNTSVSTTTTLASDGNVTIRHGANGENTNAIQSGGSSPVLSTNEGPTFVPEEEVETACATSATFVRSSLEETGKADRMHDVQAVAHDVMAGGENSVHSVAGTTSSLFGTESSESNDAGVTPESPISATYETDL